MANTLKILRTSIYVSRDQQRFEIMLHFFWYLFSREQIFIENEWIPTFQHACAIVQEIYKLTFEMT